jgi:hypothetical protein
MWTIESEEKVPTKHVYYCGLRIIDRKQEKAEMKGVNEVYHVGITMGWVAALITLVDEYFTHSSA